MKELGALALVALILWFWFGHPLRPLTNVYYEKVPAPWEKVDGFFYSDNQTLISHASGLSTVADCRTWVAEQKTKNVTIVKSDYMCGIGCTSDGTACRLRVK